MIEVFWKKITMFADGVRSHRRLQAGVIFTGETEDKAIETGITWSWRQDSTGNEFNSYTVGSEKFDTLSAAIKAWEAMG